MPNSFKWNIQKGQSPYFLTLTTVGWIDIFTRECYCKTILNTLEFYRINRKLTVYSYCIMSNHIHMILSCDAPFELQDIVRDFKKYTSRRIIEQIREENESRRDWLLNLFADAAQKHSKTKHFKVWQDGNHAVELFSSKVTWQKVNYIHMNPVKAGYVRRMEDWWYSSARNYMEMESAYEEVCVLIPNVRVFCS